MKIMTILGARPQFIKASALSRALKENTFIQEVIIHTGQHFDANMSEVFFQEMDIPKPKYNLEVRSSKHGEMTGAMLQKIEEVLLHEQPDVVLVYGDTNSTLAGALAASKLHIPIAHVEAGLRSFNKKMPEEINRVLTDHVSDFLFAPTQQAVINLRNEGITADKIHLVGDVMLDGFTFYLNKSSARKSILSQHGLKSGGFILVTIHRAENTNDSAKLELIFDALENIAKRYTVVMPLHPRTKALLPQKNKQSVIKVIEPVGYFVMLQLQHHCKLIVTDSGGIQKEAYFQQKFCVTLRDETEWVELVNHGFNYLANAQTLRDTVDTVWKKEFTDNQESLYGKGDASKKITQVLLRKLE